MSKYRMLATDLDDSLLNDRRQIGYADREAIARAVKAGVKVVLATGRMFRSAIPYARELRLDTPLIAYQGAYARFADRETVLYDRPVPYRTALELLEILARTGYHVNIYVDDQLLVEKNTWESRLYQAISNVEPTVVGDLSAYLRRVRREPTKVLVVAAEEKLDRLATELEGAFRGRLHITKSKPYFLEFMHPGATKAKALQAVAEYYGINRESIIAVGDSYNDLEMLEFAGLGVAVANAREDIRLKADYVTAANTSGGVAGVISRFIFHEEV